MDLKSEIVRRIEALPIEVQRQLLAYVDTFEQTHVRGEKGANLVPFAGALDNTSAMEMSKASNLPAKSSTPVSGRYLLDTNIVIALLNGEQSVRKGIEAAEEVFLPVIAVGELYFGAENSGRPQENLALIDQFVQARTLLPCDMAVAREYGRIKNVLKTQGTPIPENDIWIAAIGMRHGLIVATRDNHFLQIAELRIVSW